MTNGSLPSGTRRFICALGALAILAGTPAAVGQAPTSPADKSGTKGGPASAVNQPSAPKKDSPMAPMESMGSDMRGAMMPSMKGMESMEMTGDADRDFAAMMKVHHQGAIDMAQMELKHGKDPKMRAMAKRIISAQQKEINELNQWLAARK